jgi:hypothetical protein
VCAKDAGVHGLHIRDDGFEAHVRQHIALQVQAVLPSYTLSNFDNPDPFSVQSIHSPRIMSQLMLVWSGRRPITQTQKKAMEVVTQVVLSAIER